MEQRHAWSAEIAVEEAAAQGLPVMAPGDRHREVTRVLLDASVGTVVLDSFSVNTVTSSPDRSTVAPSRPPQSQHSRTDILRRSRHES